MNFLILLPLLLSLSSFIDASLSSTLKSNSVGDDPCSSIETMYFPDPASCDHFYECTNTVPALMSCGDGTYWNQAEPGCDWPEHSTCYASCNATCQHGQCSKPLFKCKCESGFQGADCDECVQPRFQAPDCTSCAEGFYGDSCEPADLNQVSYSGGIAMATDFYGIFTPLEAFVGPLYWHSDKPYNLPKLLWFEFPQDIRVVKYSFKSRGDHADLAESDGPSKYIFWASNSEFCSDETKWDQLHIDNSGTPFGRNTVKSVSIQNHNSYRCYGFKVTETPGRNDGQHSPGQNPIAISDVIFYTDQF